MHHVRVLTYCIIGWERENEREGGGKRLVERTKESDRPRKPAIGIKHEKSDVTSEPLML